MKPNYYVVPMVREGAIPPIWNIHNEYWEASEDAKYLALATGNEYRVLKDVVGFKKNALVVTEYEESK